MEALPTHPEYFEHVRTIIGMVLGLSLARLVNGMTRVVQHPGLQRLCENPFRHIALMIASVSSRTEDAKHIERHRTSSIKCQTVLDFGNVFAHQRNRFLDIAGSTMPDEVIVMVMPSRQPHLIVEQVHDEACASDQQANLIGQNAIA